MSDRERMEQVSAEREARTSSARRTSRGPVARAVEAALTQYLVAEQYHEAPSPAAPVATTEPPADEQDDSAGGA